MALTAADGTAEERSAKTLLIRNLTTSCRQETLTGLLGWKAPCPDPRRAIPSGSDTWPAWLADVALRPLSEHEEPRCRNATKSFL
jgi:hypothetical protein